MGKGMKHEKMKIIKMLDEILSFSFLHQATKMDIKIEIDGNNTIIKFNDNSKDITGAKLEEIRELLNIEKQSEVEEYYWELIGQRDYADEFTIVGFMTDKATINYSVDKGLELTLYRTNV